MNKTDFIRSCICCGIKYDSRRKEVCRFHNGIAKKGVWTCCGGDVGSPGCLVLSNHCNTVEELKETAPKAVPFLDFFKKEIKKEKKKDEVVMKCLKFFSKTDGEKQPIQKKIEFPTDANTKEIEKIIRNEFNFGEKELTFTNMVGTPLIISSSLPNDYQIFVKPIVKEAEQKKEIKERTQQSKEPKSSKKKEKVEPKKKEVAEPKIKEEKKEEKQAKSDYEKPYNAKIENSSGYDAYY